MTPLIRTIKGWMETDPRTCVTLLQTQLLLVTGAQFDLLAFLDYM